MADGSWDDPTNAECSETGCAKVGGAWAGEATMRTRAEQTSQEAGARFSSLGVRNSACERVGPIRINLRRWSDACQAIVVLLAAVVISKTGRGEDN